MSQWLNFLGKSKGVSADQTAQLTQNKLTPAKPPTNAVIAGDKSQRICPIKASEFNNRTLLENGLVFGTRQMRRPTLGNSHSLLESAKFQSASSGNAQGKDHPRKTLSIEKITRQVQHDMVAHLVNILKHAANKGHKTVEIELSHVLDTFREYRTKGSFSEPRKLRDLSIWLSKINSQLPKSSPNSGCLVAQNLVMALREVGYKDAKYIHKPKSHSMVLETANGPISQNYKTTSEYICVTVAQQNPAELSTINSKTKDAIVNKTPSWVRPFSRK